MLSICKIAERIYLLKCWQSEASNTVLMFACRAVAGTLPSCWIHSSRWSQSQQEWLHQVTFLGRWILGNAPYPPKDPSASQAARVSAPGLGEVKKKNKRYISHCQQWAPTWHGTRSNRAGSSAERLGICGNFLFRSQRRAWVLTSHETSELPRPHRSNVWREERSFKAPDVTSWSIGFAELKISWAGQSLSGQKQGQVSNDGHWADVEKEKPNLTVTHWRTHRREWSRDTKTNYYTGDILYCQQSTTPVYSSFLSHRLRHDLSLGCMHNVCEIAHSIHYIYILYDFFFSIWFFFLWYFYVNSLRIS